jgi:hypothetical protein
MPGALLLAALTLPACQRARTCSSEVTDGSGIFRSTKTGTRSVTELRRETLHASCAGLCASRPAEPDAEACVSRCTVDAEAGKIGAHISCAEGPPR